MYKDIFKIHLMNVGIFSFFCQKSCPDLPSVEIWNKIDNDSLPDSPPPLFTSREITLPKKQGTKNPNTYHVNYVIIPHLILQETFNFI